MAAPTPAGEAAQASSKWFSQLSGVSPEAVERLRSIVQGKLDAGSCRNVMPMATPELLAAYELRASVEEALREQWDTLTAEERLSICRHPCTKRIGEQIRLPNYAIG